MLVLVRRHVHVEIFGAEMITVIIPCVPYQATLHVRVVVMYPFIEQNIEQLPVHLEITQRLTVINIMTPATKILRREPQRLHHPFHVLHTCAVYQHVIVVHLAHSETRIVILQYCTFQRHVPDSRSFKTRKNFTVRGLKICVLPHRERYMLPNILVREASIFKPHRSSRTQHVI